MHIEIFLSHLDGVKRTSGSRWIARCPAHDDHSPSLAVRELDDGRLLLRCFAGCLTSEVLDSLRMTFSDLFPKSDLLGDAIKPVRKPWNASDVLQCLALESLVLLQFANKLFNGESFTDADRARLLIAVTRFQSAERICNAR